MWLIQIALFILLWAKGEGGKEIDEERGEVVVEREKKFFGSVVKNCDHSFAENSNWEVVEIAARVE